MANYFTSLFGYLVRDKEAHAKIDTHNHDEDYAKKEHNHDEDYAKKEHNHDEDYAKKEHTHGEYVSNTMDNQVEMTFSTIGTAQIVRRGNVVNIHGVMQFVGGGTTTMSNKLTLPEWARPSEHCCYLTESSGVKVVHGSNAIDMNQVCTGYLQVIQATNSCSFIHKNTDATNGGWLYAELTYMVD